MTGRIRYLAPLIGLWLVPPMFAAGSDQVKCGPNQDRVWVYDSLNSFDIETRLKCGDSVDIISRVRGYVEIRTASGMEGYVPDAVFPDLPPLPPDDNDKPLASVIPRRTSSTSPLASSTPPASSVASVPVAQPAAAPKPIPVAMSAAEVPAVSVAATAPQPPPVVSIAPVATAPAKVTTSQPSIRTNAAAPVAVATSVKIEPEIVTTPHPPAASIRSASKAPASVSASQPPLPANTSAPVTAVTSMKIEPEIAAPQQRPAPAPVTIKAATASTAPAAPPKEFASTISVSMKESDAIAGASRDLVTEATAKVVPESEDYPDTQAQNESEDPACRIFFSAYGLTPSQYKWLADNRRKQFAEVCPAPDPGRVDYVVLFTHDSDVYADAMPAAIHTDRNGFSDFSPMTAVDTALVSPSDADRSRYEFVWVFRMQRGNFDPAKFSQRRRPQFNTEAKGSHASARTLEDAFHFMETQDPNR